MAESLKRPGEEEDPGDFRAKRSKEEAKYFNDEDEGILGGFSVDEGTLEEVMKALEKEISCETTTSPCSPSTILPSPSITINGNEESCGPSFSDTTSTVMASIDTCGISHSYLIAATEGSSIGFHGGTDDSRVVEDPEVGEVAGDGSRGSGGAEVDDDWIWRLLEETISFEFEVQY